MTLVDGIATQADQIAALRRRIHAHPELGFEERLTSDLVAERLAAWGIAIDRGLAKTAVVGIVHGRDGGSCGRAIGLRADMDALPIQEVNTFAHRSRHARTMHACGHDGHTAMLLAAAQHLAAQRDFDGTVYLIFQPAEEGRGGALAMIADGLFERYPMEAVFGMHNWPGYPVGTLAVSPGPVMASANTFKIVVHGQGSHAALPHLGIDPMPVACQIVGALQTIVSRNKRPLDTAVLSVTMVHGGEATNVVPQHCTIEGTVRAFSIEVLDLIERRMRAIAEHTCAAHEAGCEFQFTRRAPPVVNHRREALFAAEVMRGIVGAANVRVQEPSMPSEDFAFMLQAKAGCYCFIGNGDGDHRALGHGEGPCLLHNPSYDFNDALIPLGATYWVRLAQAWLGDPGMATTGVPANEVTAPPAR
jgi:hippurate hydrolase